MTNSTKTGLGYSDLPRLLAMMTGDEKHDPSAHSTLDVLWVLYDSVLNVDPDHPANPLRDRLMISKGHGPMALYAVLAARGFLDLNQLTSYGSYDSALGWHPDRLRIGAVEISSGSLGHGLAMAIGSALALRSDSPTPPHVFCLMGDGEFDEGSVHEAVALAGRLRIGNLTAIVIDNRSSTHGWPGGIARRFLIEGWSQQTVSGRDHEQLAAALRPRRGTGQQTPRVVVCEVLA